MSKNNFIDQMKPLFGAEEKQALSEYMDEGGFLTEYKKTKTFEEMIADYTGSKHCIVVNNGTISLTLASLASGIKSGDEVIVPNYTMVATPNSIKIFGAKPIFVDIELDNLCLDFELIKKAITPKTKAIILMSANGRYPKIGIEYFENLCKEKKITLIEDAAQSLGSFYPDGRHIGRAGLVGSFSFSTSKIISTGQGGALITDNDDIAKKIRKLKDFGRESGGNDIHDTIGFNFKFTDLQACVGIEQMKKLRSRIIRKKEIWIKYYNNLKNLNQIKFFKHDLENTSPWFIDCLVEDRNSLMDYLKSQNIGSRIMYPPLNKQKAFNLKGNFKNSNLIGKKGLWLPSSVQLKDSDLDRICEVITKFYNR
jgi:perosamine synthetase